MEHLISLKYLSAEEIRDLVDSAFRLKQDPGGYGKFLTGKTVGLLFEKPSLRTKTAFCVGTHQLGARPVYFGPEEIKLGEREQVRDVAKTVGKFVQAVVLRTYAHQTVLEFAKHAGIPVINGLSDRFHPSQALADLMTIQEAKGSLEKLKVAYLGDGNNVCHSLMYAIALLGGHLAIATPKEFLPQREILEETRNFFRLSGGKLEIGGEPGIIVRDADVVYTDVWISMGKERERKKRLKAFRGFQVNSGLMRRAKQDSIVMHCLPAHRGEEISDDVIDGTHSVVFTQAENRLYAAKAIMVKLLGGLQ
ncbi:MAG: ornithine carbamoyltransferase [Candidatus Omnitrophica bacterium]|nr:ornithine carbamoyltransferase [Candidatus Omnitrophota bacterium]